MTSTPTPTADLTETDDVIARLKALAAANVGRTASDDEAIGGVCESAVEEIERLSAKLANIANHTTDAWAKQEASTG